MKHTFLCLLAVTLFVSCSDDTSLDTNFEDTTLETRNDAVVVADDCDKILADLGLEIFNVYQYMEKVTPSGIPIHHYQIAITNNSGQDITITINGVEHIVSANPMNFPFTVFEFQEDGSVAIYYKHCLIAEFHPIG